VALVRTDVSERRIAFIIRVKRMRELGTLPERIASIIRIKRISELGSSTVTVLTLIMKVSSSETSVLTRAIRCHTPEDNGKDINLSL
jgi:hypothetical protein